MRLIKKRNFLMCVKLLMKCNIYNSTKFEFPFNIQVNTLCAWLFIKHKLTVVTLILITASHLNSRQTSKLNFTLHNWTWLGSLCHNNYKISSNMYSWKFRSYISFIFKQTQKVLCLLFINFQQFSNMKIKIYLTCC